jgi:hypothetical protein
MKKTILLLPLLAVLLLAPSVLGASEPTEIYDRTITLSGNDSLGIYSAPNSLFYDDSIVQWDNYVAILYSDFLDPLEEGYGFKIFDLNTGTEIYDSPRWRICAFAGSDTVALEYYEGYILMGQSKYNCGFINNINNLGVRAYDVSNPDFVSVIGGGTSLSSVPEVTLFAGSGEDRLNIYEEQANFVVAYGKALFKYNQTHLTYEGYLSNYSSYDFYDYENNVFIEGNDFYEGWERTSTLGSVETGFGNVVGFNHNFLNPEFITDENVVVNVGGDYSNIVTSTRRLDIGTPLYFFERDNILSYNGTLGIDAKFVWTDATSLITPIITQGLTNIPVENLKQEQNVYFTNNFYGYTVEDTESEIRVVVYETEEPEISLPDEALVNDPPTKSLDLLGIDNNGRFVFTAEFNDEEGGRIYHALSVGTTLEQLNNTFIRDIVRHNKVPELITSSCPSETYQPSSLIRDQRVLEFPTVQDMGTYGDFCYLTHDHNTITGSDTDTLYIFGDLAVTSDDLGGSTETSSIYLMTADNEVLTAVGFDIDLFTGGNNNISVYELGGSYFNLLLDEEPLNDWEHTILSYEFLIDFENKEVLFSLWEYSNYDQATTSRDYLVSNVTLPFRESTSNDFSSIIYNPVTTKHISAIGGSTAQYDNVLASYPEYELVGDLEAGETEIMILRSEGDHEFGVYRALLYATDSDLGLSYYENPFELTFPYDETLSSLSEEEIASALSLALAGANDGFNVLGTIEGDLVTDTLFGYFDSWNIKSTASKFMIGLFLILALIGIGGYIGTLARSNVASGIGAFSGGIGGLFLVTYWGLFPLWVTFIVSLLTIAVISNIVRNGVTGNGGG